MVDVYHRQPTANDEPYKLKSILKAKAPAGTEGIGWHRYVITQGTNTITGHRQGSREGVTVAVEEILVQLNERRLNKQVRVHLNLSPRKESSGHVWSKRPGEFRRRSWP